MAVPLDFMGEKIAVGILRLTIVSRYPFVFVCLVSKSYIASAVGTGGAVGAMSNPQILMDHLTLLEIKTFSLGSTTQDVCS